MRRLISVSLILWTAMLFAVSVPAKAAEVGPAKGTLIAVGGAMSDPAILKRFFELAGGWDASIVIIPTASRQESYGRYWRGLLRFKEAGATNLTLLHTADRATADSEDFVRPIREAQGVFFTGGRQWRLADSYLNTRTQRELEALLVRGGVIGGSSAGATIQGSYLVRGDTKTNTIMMGDHVEGFGFLRKVAIDQHLLKSNRQFDLIEVIEAHPDLLGIGIGIGLDEDTAIVVQGDEFRVIGQGYVAVYDHGRSIPPRGKFYFLAPGDRYDLKTRKAFRGERREESPFDRVKEEKWAD